MTGLCTRNCKLGSDPDSEYLDCFSRCCKRYDLKCGQRRIITAKIGKESDASLQDDDHHENDDKKLKVPKTVAKYRAEQKSRSVDSNRDIIKKIFFLVIYQNKLH